MKNIHEKYMKMCFTLAKKAEGKVSPNPLVGAVLIDKKGNVVSKGFHKKYGLSHAEVDCINNYEAKVGANPDFKGLTLYVNLEPCNHFGKTPPCADLIIKKGIKKVVVATKDPVKSHSGGIEKLKKAGIEVIEEILEDDAKKLNEIFFKNAKYNLPFVAIKTATTLDGKIATKTGSSKWITSEKSRNFVKKIRNKYDAILTSSATVIADNPSMKEGKIKVVLDSKLQTSPKSKIYNNGSKVFIFFAEEKKYCSKDYPENVETI